MVTYSRTETKMRYMSRTRVFAIVFRLSRFILVDCPFFIENFFVEK